MRLCRGIFGRWIVWVFLICFKNFVWSYGWKIPRHRCTGVFDMVDLRPPVRGLCAMKDYIEIPPSYRFHLVNENIVSRDSTFIWSMKSLSSYLFGYDEFHLRFQIFCACHAFWEVLFWLASFGYFIAWPAVWLTISSFDITHGHRRFPASYIVVLIRLSMVSCWFCLSTCTFCVCHLKVG